MHGLNAKPSTLTRDEARQVHGLSPKSETQTRHPKPKSKPETRSRCAILRLQTDCGMIFSRTWA